MNTSPIRTLSAAALMGRDLPRQPDILSPLLAGNGCALVYGPRGVGKTFFALGVACAAASGGSFLGWKAPRPHRVIYVDGKLGMAGTLERLALFGPVPASLDLPDLDGGPALDLSRPDDQYRLMEGWGDPELVVLNSIATLRTTGGKRWDMVQDFLLYQGPSGRAVLMVDQANRQGVVRGTIRRDDVFDVVVGLRKPAGWQPGDGARFEVHLEHARRMAGDLARPRLAELVPGPDGTAAWRWEIVAGSKLDGAVRLLNSGLSAEAMGAALGISRAQAFRLQARARALGLVPAQASRRSTP